MFNDFTSIAIGKLTFCDLSFLFFQGVTHMQWYMFNDFTIMTIGKLTTKFVSQNCTPQKSKVSPSEAIILPCRSHNIAAHQGRL